MQNSNGGINSDKFKEAVKNDATVTLQPASYFQSMIGAKDSLSELVVIPPELFLKKCSSMSNLDVILQK